MEVRLSGLEPEITEPKTVVFPITPQPVKSIYLFSQTGIYKTQVLYDENK